MTANRVRNKKPIYRFHASTIFGGSGTRHLLCTVIAVFVCGVAWIWYKPTEKDLAKLELEYAATKDRLQKATDEKECLQIKLENLKNDPEYVEILSRDPVPWHKPNETIFTIER
jgi:cell division protein FtsB